MILTLTEIKNHLRVDQSVEDDLIQLYSDAAEDSIRNYLNRDIPGENDSPVAVPAAIRSAILLYIGDLYHNREAKTDKSLYENQTAINLIQPYRVGMGCNEV